MTPEIKQRIQQIRQGKTPKGYKKTKEGIIPNEWNQHIINQCLRRIENPVVVEKDILYKQIGIRSHGKGLFYKEPVTGEDLGNKAVYWIEPDCFIVNIVFAWEQAIGKTTDKEIGMIGSHRFPMYKPINNCLSIDYLIYYFLTKRGTDILEAASPGGAGRNRTLGQDRFLKSTIPLPPLPEQTAIAEILSTQDRVIELKEQLLAEKKRQKKYLMQQLLTGKMRLKGFKGEWKRWIGNEIFSYIRNGFVGTVTPFYVSSGHKYIQGNNIKNGTISSDNLMYVNDEFYNKHKNSILKTGDIVVIQSGDIGSCAVVTNEFNQSNCHALIIMTPCKIIDSVYVSYLLNSCVGKAMIENHITGNTIKHILASDYKKLHYILPPLPEQTAIAEILSTADREIELIGQSIEAEKRKKKSLMQLLLTGIVRVP